MNFVLSEISKPQKHYKIYQKIESDSGVKWKDVALLNSRSIAFFYMNLLDELPSPEGLGF